jgi:aspartyl-tRNA(Asn)/glutamyl-tRNA(Gln) amidotransferase subunit C
MKEFNKEELLKIAKLSALKLSEDEIETFVSQLRNVVNYITQIQEIHIAQEAQEVRNINITREDTVTKTNYKEIISQAPQKQLNYFTVPKILDEK